MQGIATSLGGSVRFAGKIEHGQRVEVDNSGRGVFEGVGSDAGKWVVYNSLVVDRESKSSSVFKRGKRSDSQCGLR